MSLDAAARRAFIREHTTVGRSPLVPNLRLHLATEITPLWQASEAAWQRTGLPPPFWAFAWPGGQALARHVLDHPDLVQGRSVLDFASGCGLAGVAAARAGAVSVICADIDPMAAEAAVLNAALNDVGDRVTALTRDLLAEAEAGAGQGAAWDVILAGDVCYEQPMADTVTRFLTEHARAGALVLLADPGRAYATRKGTEPVARFSVPTTLELEDRAVRETTILRLRPSCPPDQGGV